ncbi:hypothetical protein FG167_13090 [Lacinutrix sp. WUR7]|uniref:hypothetical protein n=1 Tax=Lacinutrix sp. WUR7 TaxID=2653681 RepID=UPI00193EB71D|nr:hypothetical protein [Lacinutrix sp. WUR7]QRM90129.1 hypothetical protein FG167_13090 [Lacinutrix sp. WUR7]
MIKKTIQSFAFFALFQAVLFSCCSEDYNTYFDSLYFIAKDQVDGDATAVTSSDLVLNLDPVFDNIIASNFKELKKFSPAAYATTCDEDYTLKEHVSEILITANTDILGIPTGNSLNSKLSYRNPETLDNEVLENVIEVLNRESEYYYGRNEMVLNEPILAGTSLTFTVTIIIEENGRMLEATTETITIE